MKSWTWQDWMWGIAGAWAIGWLAGEVRPWLAPEAEKSNNVYDCALPVKQASSDAACRYTAIG